MKAMTAGKWHRLPGNWLFTYSFLLSAAQVDGWHSNEVPRETRARWLAGARQKGKWPLKWHFCALSSSSRGGDGRKVVALLAGKSASALPGTLYGQQYACSSSSTLTILIALPLHVSHSFVNILKLRVISFAGLVINNFNERNSVSRSVRLPGP